MANLRVFKTNKNDYVTLINTKNEDSFDNRTRNAIYNTCSMITGKHVTYFANRLHFVCYTANWDEYKKIIPEYFI